MTHNDYTETSAVKRVQDFIDKPSYTTGRPPLEGEDIDELLAKDFMFLRYALPIQCAVVGC